MPIRVQYGQAGGILRAVLEEARRAHEVHFHPRLRAFLEEGDALGALREALAQQADRAAARMRAAGRRQQVALFVISYHLLQRRGRGRPGSGENQAAQPETGTRLERAGRPQRSYREFPRKSRLLEIPLAAERPLQGPAHEPRADEAGSGPSWASPFGVK
jgi:hypothetical protein